VATCCSSTGSGSCLLRYNPVTSMMLSFHIGFGVDLPDAFNSIVITNCRACLTFGRFLFLSFGHHSIGHLMKSHDRHYWLLNSAETFAAQYLFVLQFDGSGSPSHFVILLGLSVLGPN
jgi:hypothetical protein